MATDEKDIVSLRIGQEFSSYDDFEKVIEQRRRLFYEKWHTDSGGRTVRYANARICNPALHFKAKFKYAFVNLKCIHGGEFKSTATKRNKPSLLLNCPAKITIAARRKEDCMVITKLNLEHNHELIPESCGYYHIDRKPTEEERNEIIRLMRLGTPTAQVLKHMKDTTGKIFRRYDIHNALKKKCKPQRAVTQEVWAELSNMCQEVEEDPSLQHHEQGEADDNISTLFFQTDIMRRILREYSDFIFVDDTYCLKNIGFPMCVFLCVDGENRGQVVCYAIVKDTTKSTLSDVLADFVSHNDVNVKTVVVNKDASEIATIKEALPAANVLLSRSHVVQSFKAIAMKYCSKGEREKSLDLLMTMLDSPSEEDFETAYDMLSDRLKDHVDEKWISNKECWAQHITKCILSLGSQTNSQVECHKRVLRTLSSDTESLPSFIGKVMTYHCNEGKQLALTATDAVLTTRIYHHALIPSQHLQPCSSFLSRAACNLVKEQMEKVFSREYTVDGTIVHAVKDPEEKEMNVRDDKCSCLFFLQYQLPCWHLMAYNLVNDKPLVNKESVPKRWMKSTLLAAFMGNVAEGLSPAAGFTPIPQAKKRKFSKDVQRREEASKLWVDLMNVLVSCDQETFDARCKVLQSLMESWNETKDITVVVKSEQD